MRKTGIHRCGRAAPWRPWESYVEQLLTRDAASLEAGRDPARLKRYFEAYALNTAGTVTEQSLLESAGVDRRTTVAYERLLTKLLVIEALPAWSSNRLKRLVASSAPDTTAARHLAWLRDQLGTRFLAGVVLHTGPRSFQLGDRLAAAPISTLGVRAT